MNEDFKEADVVERGASPIEMELSNQKAMIEVLEKTAVQLEDRLFPITVGAVPELANSTQSEAIAVSGTGQLASSIRETTSRIIDINRRIRKLMNNLEV